MSEHKEWRSVGFGRYAWVDVKLCDRCRCELSLLDRFHNAKPEVLFAHRRVQNQTAEYFTENHVNALYPDICITCKNKLYRGEDDYVEVQERIDLRTKAAELGIELSF